MKQIENLWRTFHTQQHAIIQEREQEVCEYPKIRKTGGVEKKRDKERKSSSIDVSDREK